MPNRVIAFSKRVEFRTLLDIKCKGITGISPLIKDTVDDFRALLNLFPSINVIIVDEPLAGADYGFILEAIAEKQESIKNIVIVSSDEATSLKRSKVFSPTKIESCFEYIRSLVMPVQVAETSYISIPTGSLVHLKILPFDFYIKLSDEKFVKRIHANEEIDSTTISALRSKGIEELYFDRSHNREFTKLLMTSMMNKVDREYETVQERFKARDEVFGTTKEMVQSVGFPSKVVELCESVLENIYTDVARKTDRYSAYLHRVKSDKKYSLQFRLVELTSFVATQMIMDMKTPTIEEDVKKVIFAAFFCDIGLNDPDHLKISNSDLMKNLWHTEKKTVEEHALKASQIISKYSTAPEGVEKIIREHHGSIDGVGFNGISPDISPLSRVLIAAKEISLALIQTPEKPVLEVVREVKARMKDGPIAQYVALFEKSCSDNL